MIRARLLNLRLALIDSRLGAAQTAIFAALRLEFDCIIYGVATVCLRDQVGSWIALGNR